MMTTHKKDLIAETISQFDDSAYISTAGIQREMHLPYREASEILDILIAQGFASPRIGSYPSKVLKSKLNKIEMAKKIIKMKWHWISGDFNYFVNRQVLFNIQGIFTFLRFKLKLVRKESKDIKAK